MQRAIDRLGTTCYDVVVVGGGIHGACAAWEAALRGLSVALVDQGDFGAATSANSQKIVHGGLRYLQSLDVKRMRESIRERSTLLRIAPHLVHPQPFLLPLHRGSLRHPLVMGAALWLNDVIACDRNRDLTDPSHRIPHGRLLSAAACRRLVPGLPSSGLAGGALWHDAHIDNTERLTLSFVRSAAEAGADAANYVQVTGWRRDGNRISGVAACDVLSGRRLDIRARLVLNTSGPWIDTLPIGGNGHRRAPEPMAFLKGMVLLTRSLTFQGVAVGLPTRHPNGTTPGLLFMTPWRGCTLVGTSYRRYTGDPGRCQASPAEIDDFIAEINAAYPAARLKRQDVLAAYVGLVPAAKGAQAALKHSQLIDHAKRDGIEGLLSVVGVKYTTARDVAEQAIDLALAKLGAPPRPSRSRTTPLWGGNIERFEAFLDQALDDRLWQLPRRVTRHLVSSYGSAYTDVLKLVRENLVWGELVAGSNEVLKAEVIHAIRDEMAVTLADVILRRTDLAALGDPSSATLEDCAAIMAVELEWDAARIEREVRAVEAERARRGGWRGALAVPAATAAPAPVAQEMPAR